MTDIKETSVKKEAAPQKSPAKKAANKPLYINGRYVVVKELPQKPKKGTKPYKLGSKKLKVTLVKSVYGCLENHQRTIEALGLKKIHQSRIVTDNEAIRGMLFKVKHLVVVEEVK